MSPSNNARALALVCGVVSITIASDHLHAQQSTPSLSGQQVAIPQVEVKAPARKAPPKQAPVPQQPTPAQAVAGSPVAVETQAPVVPNGLGTPTGQTVTSIDRTRFDSSPTATVADILQESPGISVKQGNGPRDMGVSIRGSNARNGFGVRNVTIFEDGFPVTQPDGLSRTDLTDPHAYAGVDVYRGPSSVQFGNYATGGALNFRTRSGGQINGWEQGVEVGSFGYLNNYTSVGGKAGGVEASLFASDVRGDGYISHSSYDTQTVNFLMSIKATEADTVTIKVIDNQLSGDLSPRLTLNQFNRNPYQQGCAAPSTAAPGCAVVGLFNNGFGGARTNYSADQAGLNRDDRRTIAGVRWEHEFGAGVSWRNQFVFDNRDINQPTGTTSAIGVFPSYNFMSDLTVKDRVLGYEATHVIGAYTNTMEWISDTYNVMPFGHAKLGSITNRVDGETTNAGVHAREEIKLGGGLVAVAGAAWERSELAGTNFAYTYSNAGAQSVSTVSTDRSFDNTAWELGLVWKLDRAWSLRGRVATAYGIPQVSNMFTLSSGAAGDNTALKPQRNLGYDAGIDWTPFAGVTVGVTGFYEFFTDELVTQSSPTPNRSFTFNAPASEHRGVEAAIDWRFGGGWRLTGAYTYNDQFYTDYSEQLGSGATFSSFDRAGQKIPGVSPNELLARAGYDVADGALKGWGAYAEYQWKDSFYVDNGNKLEAPGYGLVNLNIHYKGEHVLPDVEGVTFFAEVRNVFDKVYVASANNITNSLAAKGVENSGSVLAGTASGSIYAGAPRTFVSGIKVKF